MTENEVFEQSRHKFVCILKEIVRGEINEEISGMFDETILYIEEIRDAIKPLMECVFVLRYLRYDDSYNKQNHSLFKEWQNQAEDQADEQDFDDYIINKALEGLQK